MACLTIYDFSLDYTQTNKYSYFDSLNSVLLCNAINTIFYFKLEGAALG